MKIDAATFKPSQSVILSGAKNLGLVGLATSGYRPEMFRFAQRDNAVQEVSSNHAS
jgi:hypothetical protein